MSNIGLGVMLSKLGGNHETVQAIQGAIGKQLTAIALTDNGIDRIHELILAFGDGSKIKLFDDGQSCCEDRYMQTDDDLAYFVGALLVDIELRDAPNEPDEDGDHEVQFLIITTSMGAFTIANHNEHNGYYGGFALCAKIIE